jgi:hypothetical protein
MEENNLLCVPLPHWEAAISGAWPPPRPDSLVVTKAPGRKQPRSTAQLRVSIATCLSWTPFSWSLGDRRVLGTLFLVACPLRGR